MQNILKNEVFSIVDQLKKEGKIALAQAIEDNWDLTLMEYSNKIQKYNTTKPMESILNQALNTEF
ncbi:MAG: hypothetical protein M3P22_01545 [bacterium]|nr:hypothetical protein [bacterium]